MRRIGWRLVPWMGVLALILTAGPGARAQCGSAPKGVKPAVWHMQDGQARFELAGARRDDDDEDRASIVGLWHTNYTATFDINFPPGAAAVPPFPFLESYKTWHADGTEWENAFLPPSGGNVCYGVWKSGGHSTFKLHHIGLMFDPGTGKVAAVFTIDETDVVAGDGKTYKGAFDFKLFDPSDVFGAGTPFAEVKGNVAATRITVN